MRKGEELKAPCHASPTTTRNDRLPYSRYWQLFFYSCYLYTLIDYYYIKILSKEEEERWGLTQRQGAAKALVVSELIAIFYAGHKKS